jgi:endonuclease/exonuclease/phosphatase (EEP) superfamily protein YafD
MRSYDDFSGAVRRFRGHVVQWRGWASLVSGLIFFFWVYVVLAAAWLVLWATTGEAILPIRLMLHFSAWIALGVLVAFILGVWHRRWVLATVSALVALPASLPYVPQFLPSLNRPAYSGATFTVMSYNTLGRNADVAAISRTILKQKPDVLFLQEFRLMDALLPQLDSLYDDERVYAVAEQPLGLGIVSRFPVIEAKGPRGIQKASLQMPCGVVRAWTLRAPKVFGDREAQSRFIDALLADMRNNSGPAIAGGDYNTTESSRAYRELRKHLRNAHEDAGFGLGATFPAPGRRMGRFLPAMIRIDHIFYSGGLVALDSAVVDDAGGSDHYPVKARFGWSGDKCDADDR